MDDPRRTEVEIVRAGAADAAGATPVTGEVRTIELGPEAFARWRGRAPVRVGEIGAVRSERDAFVISVVLVERRESARIAIFSVGKRAWDDWWSGRESKLGPREARTIAGGESPGGRGFLDLSERSRSTPSAFPADSDDTWDDGSLDDLPHPRANHAKVWTGSLMVVWGGYDGVVLNTGGRYDPATDSWTAMSTANAPSAREHPSAAWTGTVVVVRGGRAGSFADSGGRYDPATDTWSGLGLDRDAGASDVARPSAPGSSTGIVGTLATADRAARATQRERCQHRPLSSRQ